MEPLSEAERNRLAAEGRREPDANWKRWGPYLSERQWGTVREDYSQDGKPWRYFTYEVATWRAYRWGEDGLLGITDRQCRLCFSVALWNGADPILKERLFGLTGPEGNHGEDVKEAYYYLDSTPTHSYMKALYKYPQSRYPYEQLREENARRTRSDAEFELTDTGVFDEGRYFDVQIEYAKSTPDDVLIRVIVSNRSTEPAPLHLLPTWWFRNTWSWGPTVERPTTKPKLTRIDERSVSADHETLGNFLIEADVGPDGTLPRWMFTENETNTSRIDDPASRGPSCKDAFHLEVVEGLEGVVNPKAEGTKAAAHYVCTVPGNGSVEFRFRMAAQQSWPTGTRFGDGFDRVFASRIEEADAFSDSLVAPGLTVDERRVLRQANAGLLWTKQFYHYVVRRLAGRAIPIIASSCRARSVQSQPRLGAICSIATSSRCPTNGSIRGTPPGISAFHMIPLAELDPDFAKEQVLLFLREWYMHPNGQIARRTNGILAT